MPDSPVLAPPELSLTYVEDVDVGDPELGGGAIAIIGPGTGFGTATGTVGEADGDDTDFSDTFLFTAPDDALSVVSISLEPGNPSDFGQLSGSLYTADGRYITNITAFGALLPTTLYAGIGESYYVEVFDTGASTPVDYTLSLQFGDAGTDDASFGTVPVGDAADAAESTTALFPSNDGYSALYEFVGNVDSDSDPADFIAFDSQVTSNALLNLQVRGGDASVTVVDAQGTEEIYLVTEADGLRTINVPVEDGETYFFGVSPVGTASVDYSWDIRFPGVEDGPQDTVDGSSIFDAPDLPTEAPLLVLDDQPVLVSGSVTDADSGDVYAFVATSEDAVSIEVLSSTGQVYGSLYDSNEEFIAPLWPLEDANFGGEVIDVVPGETYFLELFGASSAELFEVRFTPGNPHVAPAGSEDAVTLAGTEVLQSGDAGGSLELSTLAPLNGDGDLIATGSLGHVDADGVADEADVYRFVAAVTGTANVSVLSNTGVAASITLFDASGGAVASDADNEGGGAFSVELTAGELYALEIPYSGAGAGDYALAIDTPAPGSFDERSFGSLLGDAGNSGASALDLTLSDAGDAVLRGSVGIGSDSSDVFSVVPAVDGDLVVFLDDVLQTGISLTVEDVSAGSSSEAIPVLFFGGQQAGPLPVLAGQEYLVTVDSPAPLPGLYTLTINAPGDASPDSADDVVNGVSIGDAPSDLESSHFLDLALLDRYTVEGSLTGFNFETGGDILDGFSLVPGADGPVEIILADVVGAANDFLSLAVYESGSEEPLFTGGFSTQDSAAPIRPVSVDLLAGVEYLVAVSGFGGPTDYSLHIDAAPAFLTEGSVIETPTGPVLAPVDLSQSFSETDDIGDQFSTEYLVIGPGTGIGEVSGAVGSINEFGIGDVDTLLFTSPNDALSVITLNLSWDDPSGEASFQARLRSGNDRTIGTLFEEGSLELFAGISETYYLELFSFGGGEVTYTLAMDIRDGGEDGAEATAGVIDVGDAPALVQDVIPSPASLSYFESFTELAGNVGGALDAADFFAVQSFAQSTAQVVARVRGGDARVTVIDNEGVADVLVLPDGSESTIDVPVAVDGVYYFGIEANGDDTVDYSWDLKFAGPDDGPLDTINGVSVFDAPYTHIEAPFAAFLLDRVGIEGSVSEQDWRDSYQFIAPGTGNLLLDFSSSHGRLSTELWASADEFLDIFAPLAGTSFGGGSLSLSAAGTYFLQVGSSAYDIESYQVALQLGSPHTPPPDTADTVTLAGGETLWSGDAGGSPGRSTLSPLDGNGDLSVAGHIGHDDDALANDSADVFRFVATANGMAEISLDSDGVDVEGGFAPVADSIAVFDAAGTEIAFESNHSGSALLSVDLNTGEVYAVQVNGNADAGAYSLFVDAPTPAGFEERVGYTRLGDAGPDADAALALVLSDAGDTVVNGSTGFGDDLRDTFVFTASASGELSILLTDDHQTPLNLILTDIASGNSSGSFQYTDFGRAIHGLTSSVVEGQDYLVSVESTTPLPSRYTLTVNAPTALAPAAGSEAVDGASIGEAAADTASATAVTLAFTGDATVTGTLGDAGDASDVFSFTAPAAGSARIIARDLITEGGSGVTLSLFSVDSAQQPLTEWVLFPTADGVIQLLEVAVEAGGEYLISVNNDASAASYTLAIDAPGGDSDFIYLDRLDDGLLYDADFLLDSGEFIIAEDAQLYRTYGGALGRVPDVGGFDWWSEQIAIGNHDLDSMVAGFIWSDEFLSYFPGATRPIDISSADFVSHMYENVFGRAPDEGGFNFWTGVLDSGQLSQARVVVEMTQSNEFIGLNANGMIDFLIG